ncbi:DUF106 domain-containing protein [Candidatus Woesearchaeota archaeon]|nr:DUF106 domain-containing protein [Candidatus Woesearchaeota archaeon]
MVLESLNVLLDKWFGSFVTQDPLLTLLGITFVMTLIVTLAYKYLTDQEKMKFLKNELKELQDKSKAAQGDAQKMKVHTSEMWKKNMEYMKHSFGVMLYTMIPFIILFGWLRVTYTGIDLNFLGFIHSWLIIYIIFSMVLSSILRKVMKVY